MCGRAGPVGQSSELGGVAVVDVFISYSRDDAEKVGMLARMIASEGYDVWWDADLPPHMSYGDVITAKIGAAKAAVVVWSETAAKSEWVRAEADVARNQKKLIQTAIDDIMPPLPFNQIQCAAIGDWTGETDHRGWSKVKQSLVALCGPRDVPDQEAEIAATPQEASANARAPIPASPKQTEPSGAPIKAAPPSSRPPVSRGGDQPKKGMSTPLIIALGCGGLAVLGFVLLVVLALIGMSIEDPDELDYTQPDDIIAPMPMAPDDDAVTGGDPVPGGDYIPQLETAPAPPVEPVGAGFVIATIQDPDGYTNVRAGPSTSSPIIARVEEGDTFTTYQQSDAWWIVQLEDGTEGYIFSDRIFVIGPQ